MNQKLPHLYLKHSPFFDINLFKVSELELRNKTYYTQSSSSFYILFRQFIQ